MSDERQSVTDEEALAFHRYPEPGKIAITATKPMATQRDLSLAYSPGVAAPVLAIAADPELAYEYTSKGNLVAVISNGTAILGLGDLGSLASKPVMEGKSVLFKRFADVDSIDIEVDNKDADAIIETVANIGGTFGGINLEDIKSPECFRIETELQERLDIPVFHDDQHGTAIISCAGLINACAITGRRLEEVKLVLCGAGAAGIATLELVKAMGARPENCIAVDNTGVIYRGRENGMNQWKSAHAIDTDARTLADAMKGADVFLGVSVKGAVTQAMVSTMAAEPIIFAMANPDPEITPEEVLTVRPDAIVATGRSDYPEPGQQRAGLPLHLPRRAGRAGAAGEPGDEDRLRPGPGRAGAGGRAGRGGRRLSRPAAQVRPQVHHPHAVRSAADLVHPALRRRGGDGRRGWPARRSRTWTPIAAAWPSGSIRPPASCRRSPARCSRGPRSGSCSPRARSRA